MQSSALLDSENLPEGGTAPHHHHNEEEREAVRRVACGMRQLRLTFTPATTTEAEAAAPIVVHVSFQGFLDALWVLVTEDGTCAPGVVMCCDGMPEHGLTGAVFKYNGETPAVECEALLGMRDHPLTNLVASTVAHVVRQFGEARALVMCLSVSRTATALKGTEDKRSFLTLVREAVMELAKGGGAAAS